VNSMVNQMTASLVGAGIGSDVSAVTGAALFVLLFVLVLVRELLRVGDAERFVRVRPVLDMAAVPMLIAFCVLMASRLVGMLGG
jgi:hypothetical protein